MTKLTFFFGKLASFMLGYMMFAPLFGHLSRKYRPAALMSIGLCIWCLATIATGWYTLLFREWMEFY